MADTTEAPRAHDPFSASKSHRWMACPGCVELCKDIPDKSGPAAERGNRIHNAAEEIEKGLPIPAGVGDDEAEIAAKFVIAARASEAQFVPRDDGMLVIEAELDLKFLGIQLPGFADRLTVGDDIVVVTDYKGGSVYVPAVGNPQGAIYCLGAARSADVSRAVFIVIQMGHGGEPEARSWVLEAEDLQEWEAHIVGRRRIAESSHVLVPGEHCKYCPGKRTGKCPAVASALLIPEATQDWAIHWATLTLDQRGDILRRLRTAVDLAEIIEGLAKVAAQAEGICPTGFTFRKGRAARYWADDNAASAAMTTALDELGLPVSAAWKTEMRSVSDIEKSKQIPESFWGHLVGSKQGEPSLVEATVKKPGKKAAPALEMEEAR